MRYFIFAILIASNSIGVLDAGEPDDVTRIGGEEWPRWRGPRGDGTWQGPQLPESWPEAGLPVRWRQPIGAAYSGVTAAAGRVFTMDRPPAKEAADSAEVSVAQRRVTGKKAERVLCFDASTGKPLWIHEYAADYGDLDYGKGPRSTPTVAGNRLYTLGTIGHLHCLSAEDGRVVWSTVVARPVEKDDQLPMWGTSASPLIVGELVIVQAGAEPKGCLAAYNRHTGKEVWRSLPEPAGYATPILIERSGRKEIVCWAAQGVHGVDPASGEVHWSIPFKLTYGTAIATPVYRDQTVYVTSYFEGSKAIRLGDEPGAAKVLWEENRYLRGLMSQPLYRDGYAYQIDKSRGLTCFDFQTGKKLWDDGNRLTPRGRNPQATMVWTGKGNRVLVLNSDGELIVAEFTPKEYRELSRTKIIGETWAHPAYAWGHVFARSDTEIIALRLVAQNANAP